MTKLVSVSMVFSAYTITGANEERETLLLLFYLLCVCCVVVMLLAGNAWAYSA